MANYYQVYINNIYDFHALLNELLKKAEKMELNWKCQEVFRRIKDMLTSEQFLTHFDLNVELILARDVSNVGIGAVLLHKDKLGDTKAIARTSRGLIKAEKNCSQI